MRGDIFNILVENLQFTMTGSKRVFTIDKFFVMELFDGVALLLGQTWGKKYRVCQYFGYNVAVGTDLDGTYMRSSEMRVTLYSPGREP